MLYILCFFFLVLLYKNGSGGVMKVLWLKRKAHSVRRVRPTMNPALFFPLFGVLAGLAIVVVVAGADTRQYQKTCPPSASDFCSPGNKVGRRKQTRDRQRERERGVDGV
jgi:ABC-type uncharacterized transport system permease subunit